MITLDIGEILKYRFNKLAIRNGNSEKKTRRGKEGKYYSAERSCFPVIFLTKESLGVAQLQISFSHLADRFAFAFDLYAFCGLRWCTRGRTSKLDDRSVADKRYRYHGGRPATFNFPSCHCFAKIDRCLCVCVCVCVLQTASRFN